MRIILSRKGFDSQYGGGPSPILPDGRMYSLPIPHPKGPYRYTDIGSPLGNLGSVVEKVAPKSAEKHDNAHLDPDLYKESISRHKDWRPCFGQYGAAQQHLSNQMVQAGDLFLFFGWFKKVDSNFRPIPKQPDLHVLSGWLQIDRIITIGEALKETALNFPAYGDHPHLQASFGENNTLYTSKERLKIGQKTIKIAGGGIFTTHQRVRTLTAPDATRSVWHLPKWFADPEPALSYHLNDKKWSRVKEGWRVQSAPKGQEFVINTKGRTREANHWLRKIFEDQ